jgi:hypothetical protein
MKNTIIIISLLLCLSGLSAHAQYRSEWNIHAGGGSSTFQFNSDLLMNEKENAQAGIGGNLGVNYTYFFSRYLGVSIGIEAAMYNNSITSSYTLHTEQLIETPTGLTGNFYLRTQYEGISEKQTAIFAQLPLMLHLQLPIGSKHFFYLAAGGKYGIPLSASYTQTINTLTTTGYSEDFQQILEIMPNHGVETLHDVRLSDPLTLQNSIILALETGFKWQTTEKTALYTGVFMDTNYALGVKLGIAFGGGSKLEHSVKTVKKPMPLLGD